MIKRNAVIIFLFAFLIRFFYLLWSKINDPLFFSPQMDPLFHHQWAISILQGGWLAKIPFFRAPLYAYFLASIYKIFGIDLFIPRLIQIILGSLNCVFLYLIGKEIFSRRVGFWAGMTASCYPLLIYFDGELLIKSLLIFLILSGIYLLITIQKKKNSRYWILPGLIFGLATITRPNILLFILSIPLLLFYRYKKLFLNSILFFLLGVAIPVFLTGLRNYFVGQDFVLIAWQGGMNFYIGNNPDSDGMTAIIPNTRGTWWGGYYDAWRIAETRKKKKLKPSEVDRFWFNAGFDYMIKNPLKSLRHFLRKTYLWLQGFEISNNRDIYFFSQYTFLKYLLWNLPFIKFPFGLILPLAFVGIYFSIANYQKYLLLYFYLITYSISFILFFITARYRLPLVPIFLLFAVFGIFSFFSSSARKKKISVAIFTVSYLLLNIDFLKIAHPNLSQSYATAAIAYLEQNNLSKAYEYATQAYEIDTTSFIAQNTLGVVLENMGDFENAERFFKKAIRSYSESPEPYNNLGNIYAKRGDLTKAEEYFLVAIKLDPYAARSYNNLGNVYFQKGELKKALAYYEEALKYEPLFDLPLFHSGLVYYYLGEKEKAKEVFKKVLIINPKNQLAKKALEVFY